MAPDKTNRLGAVVAREWSDGANDPLAIPSLEHWRETTGLPWFAFWARELLRWGTLDPFVAFAMSQGLAGTRDDAMDLRVAFDAWLEENHDPSDPDSRFHPQRFLEWQKSMRESKPKLRRRPSVQATLTGTEGRHESYNVLPIVRDSAVHWIDPSGFELAVSEKPKQFGVGHQRMASR